MKIKSSLDTSSVVCHDAAEVIKSMVSTSVSPYQYLLKDGSASARPVYNQEQGVFVSPFLVMDLKISSSLMTAEMANLFYKLEKKPVPSMFQVLLLQLNYDIVEQRFADIGMSGVVAPYPLENVWYKEALEKAKPDEKRWLVTFQTDKDFCEPECDCFSVLQTGKNVGEDTVRHFLIDRKFLLELDKGKFYPRHFHLFGTWNNFDLLTFSSDRAPEVQWLFFRNRDTFKICHYHAGKETDTLTFTSDESYLFGSVGYRVMKGEICKTYPVTI